MISPWHSTGNINFGHLVKLVSASFLHCKITIFSFPYFILRRWIIKSSAHSWEGKSNFTSRMGYIYIYYLEYYYKEDLSLLPQYFFDSVIYANMYSFKFILYFGLWSSTMNCFSFGHSELFHVDFWHASILFL